mmetsp:Transcript_2303/g.6187  ORF Transcript_2303/g.6187 Transcript_2303/m.6187 type:complete len:121 (-) Transcript_2303:242-604(-)
MAAVEAGQNLRLHASLPERRNGLLDDEEGKPAAGGGIVRRLERLEEAAIQAARATDHRDGSAHPRTGGAGTSSSPVVREGERPGDLGGSDQNLEGRGDLQVRSVGGGLRRPPVEVFRHAR